MREIRGYYVPKELLLFTFDKDGNFTEKTNKISYINENGNIVNKSEFGRKTNEDLKIANDVVERFVINKSRNKAINEYTSFHGITLYDEKRDFEFEISATNFTNLCIFGKVEKGVLIVPCVFAFGNNGYPILLPVESVQYKKAISFTEKRQSVFTGEFEIGKIYSLKKVKEQVVYLGKFKADKPIAYRDSRGSGMSVLYSDLGDEVIYLNNKPVMKDLFYFKGSSPKFDGVSKSSIYEEIGDVSAEELNGYIEQYKEMNTFFGLMSVTAEPYSHDKSSSERAPVKLYLLHKNEKTQQALYFSQEIELDYDGYTSYNKIYHTPEERKKNNEEKFEKVRAYAGLIFKDKTSVKHITLENIVEVLPKEFQEFFVEKLLSKDPDTQNFKFVELLREVKKDKDQNVSSFRNFYIELTDGIKEKQLLSVFKNLLDVDNIPVEQLVLHGTERSEKLRSCYFCGAYILRSHINFHSYFFVRINQSCLDEFSEKLMKN